MNYDDWRTETREDYEHRMHVHRRSASHEEGVTEQRCRCGTLTNRQASGIGWECRACAEARLQAIYRQGLLRLPQERG